MEALLPYLELAHKERLNVKHFHDEENHIWRGSSQELKNKIANEGISFLQQFRSLNVLISSESLDNLCNIKQDCYDYFHHGSMPLVWGRLEIEKIQCKSSILSFLAQLLIECEDRSWLCDESNIENSVRQWTGNPPREKTLSTFVAPNRRFEHRLEEFWGFTKYPEITLEIKGFLDRTQMAVVSRNQNVFKTVAVVDTTRFRQGVKWKNSSEDVRYAVKQLIAMKRLLRPKLCYRRGMVEVISPAPCWNQNNIFDVVGLVQAEDIDFKTSFSENGKRHVTKLMEGSEKKERAIPHTTWRDEAGDHEGTMLDFLNAMAKKHEPLKVHMVLQVGCNREKEIGEKRQREV